jgi:hypothetical protein
MQLDLFANIPREFSGEIQETIHGLMKAFPGNKHNEFDAGKFVGELDKEMNKLTRLEKLYLNIKKKLSGKKNDILRNNQDPTQQGILTSEFTNLALKFSEEK